MSLVRLDLPEARREGQKNIDSIKVKLKFSDGSTYDEVGQINFVDVTVDRGTDSVTVRATRQSERAADRQPARSGDPRKRRVTTEKLVIPQAALIADQQGVYIFVADDGKATVRLIKPGDESGTGIVVESGLSAGDLVIVEGLQSLRPGTSVRAAPIPAVTPGG